jgi:peptidoglycan/LPS O-acetylase OafA/YrhL
MLTVETPPLVAEARPSTDVKTKQLPDHILALDGLRGLAISLVLVTHCENGLKWNQYSDVIVKALNKVVRFSTCGVDLFFVLSGFLITGILLRSKGSKHYFQNFYARRALRIFPLYYGVLLVILCATTFFGEPPKSMMGTASDRWWLWGYGTNILMTLRNNWTYTSLNHFWSLAVEEHFYLVWPFLVFACRSRPLIALCLASVPASLLIRAGFVYLLHNEIGAYVLTCCRVDALLVGCFIAIVAHIASLENLRSYAKAIICTVGLIIPVFICAVPHASATDRIFGPTLFALFFGGLLVSTLLSASLKRTFENRLLRELGKYSYGIYVYHFLIIAGLERCWNWAALPPVPNYFAFLAVASSLSMAVAWVSYQCYEVHF